MGVYASYYRSVLVSQILCYARASMVNYRWRGDVFFLINDFVDRILKASLTMLAGGSGSFQLVLSSTLKR